MQRVTKIVIMLSFLVTSAPAMADLDTSNPGASDISGSTNQTATDVTSQAPEPPPPPSQVKPFTPSGPNQSYFCPSGGRYVQTGMSIVDVQDACGIPQAQQKLREQGTNKIPVKQWLYRISSPAVSTGFLQFTHGPPTTLMIYFKDSKVSSIQLGGSGAQSSSLCDGAVNIGDSPNQVQAVCGSPAIQNETFENESNGTSSDIELWTYKPTQYGPSATLKFVNGFLDSIKQ